MSVLNILSFVGFTALVAILSYYWTKGTDEHHSEGYFLGGRSLTAPVIVVAHPVVSVPVAVSFPLIDVDDPVTTSSSVLKSPLRCR